MILSTELNRNFGCDMAQISIAKYKGLNQRFNPAAVICLREVFTSLLTQKLCSNQSLSSHLISTFKRIRILDATVFQLPDQFALYYQGSGGSSNTAGVKIQLEYDLLSGQFLNVQLGPGKNNDKTYGTISLETVVIYACAISVTSI